MANRAKHTLEVANVLVAGLALETWTRSNVRPRYRSPSPSRRYISNECFTK